MKINLKIKTIWPFSRWFNKEAVYEILPELTPDEKRLARELKLQELKSAIKSDRAGSERSMRG